jgi:ankyrin repeat protein
MVLKNDQQQVTGLLQSGADPNTEDADHSTPLRVAVVTGRTELVRVLLDHGAKPDMPDEEGTTADGYVRYGQVGDRQDSRGCWCQSDSLLR